MDTKTCYCAHLAHDYLSFAFTKFLERSLEKAGFERSFERMDPSGMDVYQYKAKEGHQVMITHTRSEGDKDELKISSEWNGITDLVDTAADAFAKDIASSIKQGRQKKCSCC